MKTAKETRRWRHLTSTLLEAIRGDVALSLSEASMTRAQVMRMSDGLDALAEDVGRLHAAGPAVTESQLPGEILKALGGTPPTNLRPQLHTSNAYEVTIEIVGTSTCVEFRFFMAGEPVWRVAFYPAEAHR